MRKALVTLFIAFFMMSGLVYAFPNVKGNVTKVDVNAIMIMADNEEGETKNDEDSKNKTEEDEEEEDNDDSMEMLMGC